MNSRLHRLASVYPEIILRLFVLKRVDYCSITFDKGDLLEIVSAHRKHVRDLLNELTKGEVLYFYAFASKSPGRLSRNTYPPMPVFNEFNSKLQFGTNNFNEVWSNTAFKNGVNNIKVQYITYRLEFVAASCLSIMASAIACCVIVSPALGL